MENTQELCFITNNILLSNFSKSLNITLEDLKEKLILVSKHQDLVNMATQILKAYKNNPNAYINFGEYGKNMAIKLNINEEKMYEALLVSSSHELLMNIVSQLKNINEKDNK